MSPIDAIQRWAVDRPDAEAMRADGRSWSWRALDAEVQACAGRLAALGVREGDRVAVLAPNRPEVVPLFHAAGRLGATWAPLNVRLTGSELAQLIDRLRPRVVIADEKLVDRAPGAIPFEVLARSEAVEPAYVPASPSRTRALLFTSGTSGRAKAVELSEGNFDANARLSASNLGGDPGQRWLACLPFFHVGGLAMIYRCAALGGALVVQPRFEAAQVARALREEGITHVSVVPTGLGWVLDLESSDSKAPAHLRVVLVGGGPMSAELLGRARSRGYPVLQTYGLTEACSQVCTERPDQADGSTAGPPLDQTEIRIVDDEGRELPAGEVGEIEVRGPTVMRGYFEDPEATAEAFREGWLRTKDLGCVDASGRLRMMSRRTDLIVSGGENVYPAEIEGVLATHPAVAEVAVLGVEDPVWGQVPVALWASGSRSREAEDFDAWSRARLAGFKVPRRFIRVEALPRTGSGKVDRGQLRSMVSNEGKTR